MEGNPWIMYNRSRRLFGPDSKRGVEDPRRKGRGWKMVGSQQIRFLDVFYQVENNMCSVL